MSKTCALFIALIAFSFFYVEVISAGNCDAFVYNAPAAAAQDNSSVIGVEKNGKANVSSWDGIVRVVSRHYKSLDLSWNAPQNLEPCIYRVHFYSFNGDTIPDVRYSMPVAPDQLSVTIGGLSPGTRYHVFVEAAFSTTLSDLSYVLSVNTLACNCNPSTTEGADVNNCDDSTGQCACTNPVETAGRRCESCLRRSYMNSVYGCVACDQCGKNSYGTCQPAPSGTDMQCDCLEGFEGKHCTECAVNYYGNDSVCLPCNCNNNQMANSTPICDQNGICLRCDFHTYGDHCQVCYPGYVGDALKRTCELASHAGKDAAIAILVIVLIAIVFVMAIVFIRRCARQRRLGQFRGQDGGSRSSGVNFKELNEEPDVDFRGRKLQIVTG